jgi:HSP20 family molecular chaperone IbpA
MTTRLSLFDHPFFLGFDHFEREFDRIKKTSDGYPPYNVEQIDENHLRITLAIAGFTMDDLHVEVENNQLLVRGKTTDNGDRVYLHRGIATRQFQKSFVLADGVEVKEAFMDNGLLHIDMERIVPESKARRIHIQDKNDTSSAGKHIDAIDISSDDTSKTKPRSKK